MVVVILIRDKVLLLSTAVTIELFFLIQQKKNDKKLIQYKSAVFRCHIRHKVCWGLSTLHILEIILIFCSN
jgi:hypothetical protein